MSITDKLTYTYIKRIKRWMECPICHKKMTFSKTKQSWICNECGYSITEKEFLDDFVFWFCDECNSYLNNQEGFNKKSSLHICTECGYENDITFENIKGMCRDCGKPLVNPDSSLCDDCKEQRRAKAKERLITVGKIVGTVAAVAGVVCLAAQRSDSEESEKEYLPLPDESDPDYPICKSCGAKMTRFDGWAWYTCPECGNSVRIIDGITTWYDEIFRPGKKEHYSDFDLADFCRGGDLTEDQEGGS